MEVLADMIEPDTIIDGRYRVISRLGSGGMADVYLAEDQLLGRQLAVKLLHHHFAEDQEFVERFRREASSAAALSHPNIVAIFDRGEWNGTYYIAMEYLAGRSLKTDRARAGAARPGRRDRHRHAGPARRALRAPARGHPPRPQAPQRDPRRGGPRAGHRLRDRPGGRLGHDPDRLDHGHRAVPLARAGPGPRGQRTLRPLRGRGDPLRAAHRLGPVRRRDRGRDRLQAGLGRAAAAERAATRRSPPSAGRDRAARARQGPGAALRRRRRVHRGAPAGPCGIADQRGHGFRRRDRRHSPRCRRAIRRVAGSATRNGRALPGVGRAAAAAGRRARR